MEHTLNMDRRCMDRYQIRVAIFYGQEELNLMSDYSVNMSTGGVFIETRKILPQDEYLYVEFMLPEDDHIITCKSRVAWTNCPEELVSPELPPGMGLQFIDLPLDELSSIRQTLSAGEMMPVW